MNVVNQDIEHFHHPAEDPLCPFAFIPHVLDIY